MTDDNGALQWLKLASKTEHSIRIGTIYTLKAIIHGQHVFGGLPVGFGENWIYQLDSLQ